MICDHHHGICDHHHGICDHHHGICDHHHGMCHHHSWDLSPRDPTILATALTNSRAERPDFLDPHNMCILCLPKTDGYPKLDAYLLQNAPPEPSGTEFFMRFRTFTLCRVPIEYDPGGCINNTLSLTFAQGVSRYPTLRLRAL